MKSILLISLCFLTLLSGCSKNEAADEISPAEKPAAKDPVYTEKDLYYYSYTSIQGKPVKLSSLKGKKILFVNTASLCSNTPQYEKLEALYKKYSSKLVIIGFPCNQFGDQEPGKEGEIEKFCIDNYHVTFPLSAKVDVLGDHQHPVYKWLTTKALNGKFSGTVAWNFEKYLVDEKGNFVSMFENYTQPDDPAIIAAIE